MAPVSRAIALAWSGSSGMVAPRTQAGGAQQRLGFHVVAGVALQGRIEVDGALGVALGRTAGHVGLQM
jgi:hypothetical protein